MMMLGSWAAAATARHGLVLKATGLIRCGQIVNRQLHQSFNQGRLVMPPSLPRCNVAKPPSLARGYAAWHALKGSKTAAHTSSSKMAGILVANVVVGAVAFKGTIVGSNVAQCESLMMRRVTGTPVRLKGKAFKGSGTSEEVSTEAEKKPQALTLPFRVFLKYLVPDILLLLAAVLTAFGSAYLNIRIPAALGGLINVFNDMSKSGEYDQEVIKHAAVSLVNLYAVQALLSAVYISLLSIVGENLATRLRRGLFESLIKQDMAFFDARQTGEIVGRLTNDVQEFKSAFKSMISQGLRSTTQMIGSVVAMYMISPKLCAITGIIVPSMVAMGSLFGHFLRVLSRSAQVQVSLATSVAQESIGNIRTVKAFAMEPQEIELFDQQVQKSAAINKYLGIGIGLFQGVSNFAINGMVLVVLSAGGTMVGKNEITGGELMSFLMATQSIQKSMGTISTLFGSIVRGSVAGARVFQYIQEKPNIRSEGGLTLSEVRGEVEFRGVEFVYPTRPKQKVLDRLWLRADAGRVLALCGPSGSGKSTIGGLMLRFYDPALGAVLLDGIDIKDVDPHWLRGHLIGYIGQEPVLFHTSISENIRYGKPGASDDEVQEAARRANAHDFINHFPNGYNTVVGERGVTLSGGQRQRIAIARALLKDPKILILDEATSALDAESEHVVQEALDRLLHGRTVIVIAHRLSTIRNADKIAVLKNGKIAEQGTHDDLMARGGIYADLVARQLSPDLLEQASNPPVRRRETDTVKEWLADNDSGVEDS